MTGLVRLKSLQPFTGAVLLGVALTSGCDWWLRITEVSGTVLVNGKPAEGVQLVFQPVAKNRPRAFAQTGKDGTYRLGRQGPGDKSGAASGAYRIQVLSDSESPNPIAIPPEYNVNTTLEFEVVPGKKNVFDIDVKTNNR
jgi:hypothetical protein